MPGKEHQPNGAEAAPMTLETLCRRLETIMRTLPSGVVVVGAPDGRVLFANQRAAELCGTDLADLSMETYRQRLRLLGPDGSPLAPEQVPIFRALLSGKEVWDAEVLIEHADGKRLVARAHASPILDEGGRIAAAVAAFEDVTDLKQTEAALRAARDGLEEEVARRTSDLAEATVALQAEVTERQAVEADLLRSNELLQTIFDTTHLLIAYLDTDLNFVRVNRTYAEADDREPDFYVGKNHFALFPNEENEAIFREVLRTGRPYYVTEKPFVYAEHPERGTTWWDWSLLPVYGPDGQMTGLLLSLLDVTERVRAREAREAQRRHLFDVLNVLPGFVALVSPEDHTVRFANRRFVETVGQYEGRWCYELMRGREGPCPECHCTRVLETGRPEEWEAVLPSGRVYHVRAYPFAEADGTPLVLELGVDVTEERRLRDEVVAAGEAERQRMGQDLHDLLGQDLTALAYVAESLASRLEAEGSTLAGRAATLHELARKASTEARRVARGLCPVDLSEEGLVEALRDLADRTRELYGIPCALECPDPVFVANIVVATDLFRIAQEAVHNAVKHAQPRRLRLSLTERDGVLTLSVEDDGTGLADDADRGQGMGLRVMQYRASRIGGRLRIQSQPGGGTCITCRIPRSDDAAPLKETGDVP
jgi:PAS domain S-box-containing protein